MTKQEIIEIIRQNTPWVGNYYQEVNEGAIADVIIARQDERLKDFVEWLKTTYQNIIDNHRQKIVDENVKADNKLGEVYDCGRKEELEDVILFLDRDLEKFLEETSDDNK